MLFGFSYLFAYIFGVPKTFQLFLLKPIFISIILILVTFFLGIWQLYRLDWKNSLIKKFQINPIIDLKNSYISPGQFIKFNYIFYENKITLDGDYLSNLGILLNLYKKKKESLFIDMILRSRSIEASSSSVWWIE